MAYAYKKQEELKVYIMLWCYFKLASLYTKAKPALPFNLSSPRQAKTIPFVILLVNGEPLGGKCLRNSVFLNIGIRSRWRCFLYELKLEWSTFTEETIPGSEQC